MNLQRNKTTQIEINDYTVEALIDTGAVVSCIDEELSYKLKLKVVKDNNLNLKAAGDQKLNAKGRSMVSFNMDQEKYTIQMIVLEKCNPKIILGDDFLSHYKALINCRNNTLWIESPNNMDQDDTSLKYARAVEDRIIPEFSLCLFKGYCEPTTDDKEILIENLSSLTSKYGLITTRSLLKNTRNLNSITVKDQYPLPRIDDCFDSLHGSRYFTSLDLCSGYWQVEVEEQDREKNAFVTPDGLYHFNVLPFGLCNGPATFERLMDNILRTHKWNICLCYLDDVIVFSEDLLSHLTRLKTILGCLRKAGLTLNLSKCRFAYEELLLLGHVVSKEGITPDPEKIANIKDFPALKTIKNVRAFLGLCSYYRRFIKEFSKIAFSLQILTRKNQPFVWGKEQESSFLTLKEKLSSPEVLTHYDPNKPIGLHTDASDQGLGAVLIHVEDNGRERPISYASRTLQKAETNYSTTEKECLAIIWAIEKFRPYLYGRKFIVYTDHHSLCWMAKAKKLSGRLARWSLELQAYDFTINYKSGKTHLDADGLSRCPIPDKIKILQINYNTEDYDAYIKKINNMIDQHPNSYGENFTKHNGKIYKNNPTPTGNPWLLVIPKTKQLELLEQMHDHPTSGHMGIKRTYSRIKDKYFWPSMFKTVEKYVSSCPECQFRKTPSQQPSGQLQPIPPASRPFERIGIDLLGRFPKSIHGNRWIVVCTDYYSRHVETAALPRGTATEIADFFLKRIVLRHGAPKILISDRGSSFLSKLLTQVLKICNTIHKKTTSYHPQTNGQTERMNRTLTDMISMYIDEKHQNWDEILPFVTFAYNSSVQETTGYSPYFLIHGREPLTFLDSTFDWPEVPPKPGDFDDYISNLLTIVEESKKISMARTMARQDKSKQDRVELKEMTVKKEEATQVGNYFVQHLPRNPSMFSGEDGEDPLTWLKGYNRVAKYNHWDETLCLANVYFYLNGTALKWFENNEETIRNWGEFTTQLESVFGKSESLRLLAEKKLKIRAQLKGESTEFYIQDVLRLCKEVDLQMSEEDKISHLMKGIVEELYQALLPKDINNTDQFVSECRRIEALHRRRVTPAKYERLPNVASLDVCNDNTDLSSMIRQIVREEVQRALAAPREEPRIATIEDMVREEIDKTLAPITNPSRGSPKYRTYTPSPIARRETAAPQIPRPRARYSKQGERLDTSEWRTTEGRPICFHCGRPGHVARNCRDRRRQNDERENGYSQGRQEPMFFYGSRPKFPALNDDEPRDNFRRYRSPSPYPGRNGQHSSPIRGSKEFLVEDTPRNNSPLYAEREYRIEPASCQLIEVLSRDISDNATVVAESQRGLSLERELMAPSSIISLTSNRGKLWVANWSPYPKIIPQGMHVADGVVIEDSQLCVLAEGNHVGTDIGHSEDSKFAEILNIDDSLDDFQKEKLRNLLRNYRDIFDFRKKEASKTDNVKHRISTGDHLPTKQRPYRVAPAERQIIQEEVNKMEEIGIIQPSASPWASPVVLVRKKDGSWRFCVDYRRLNKITKKDVYPLPRIDDTLDCLQGARFYSSMDLQSGYWQIDVEESDCEKTAFITPDGLYEFKVMPFGLCNAPATFERMMDGLLKGLRWTVCLCYLDDIVVFSDDFEEHLRRLQLVLGCLRKAGLCLNPGKCRFGAKTITVLGHKVSGDGICLDPEKIRAVRDFPRPKSLKEVRSFLGLSSYYRRFIPNYAHMAQPLNALLKKDSVFSWNIEERHAFEALKSALISEPVLGHFDHSSPTEIHTDASNYGIGAVLVQIQKGKERAIAYASRTLDKAERNYSTTERECLAVIWAIGKFRPYVFGRQFTIVTDHHSLCWLANLKDPCGRLARWALRLQEFDVTVVHKSGRKHQDADCLSRSPLNCSEDIEEYIPCIVALQNFGREQMKDPDLTKIADKIQQETSNKSFIKINDTLHKKNYDPMGREWLLVVPRHLRPEILRNLHDSPTSGHLGFTKTYDRIRKKFYWPGMYRNVRKYVAHCPDCQRRKRQPQLPPGLLQPIPVPIAAFEKVGMDLLGRFPTSMCGNRWIIVCTDYLTKFAITKALPTSESVEVAKFFIKDVILKHGAPREVITDRGRNFTSSMIRDLNKHCRIIHRTTTAYHPQTNGLTERLNKTIADILSIYVDVNQKDWDEILPFVTFAYNTAKQESTGFSPFYLVHGREAETPLDLLFPKFPSEDEDDFIQTLGSRAEEARQLARIHTMRSQGENKLRYDAHHRNIVYQPGDLVWIYIPVRKVGLSEKLMRRYFGPYRVTRKISDVTYEVETFGDQHGRRKTKDIVHICRMKPYLDPEEREDHLEEDMEDNSSSPQGEEVSVEGRRPPLAQEEVPRPGDLDIPGPVTRSRARRLEAQ
ncbi:hypothetical protein LAZ67_5004277, partial [Cordylochernes scorpioides]